MSAPGTLKHREMPPDADNSVELFVAILRKIRMTGQLREECTYVVFYEFSIIAEAYNSMIEIIDSSFALQC